MQAPSLDLTPAAVALARRGFRVFRLKPGSKVPVAEGWQAEATADPERVAQLWAGHAFNVGIAAGPHLVVDVDPKNNPHVWEQFGSHGFDLNTLTVETPSGGRHYYFADAGLRSTSGTALGPGIDTRGEGGYTVGPGSWLDGTDPTNKGSAGWYRPLWDAPLARLPAETAAKLQPRAGAIRAESRLEGDDHPLAVQDGTRWLVESAPLAIEGNGGDYCTYRVACELRDRGLSRAGAYHLLLQHWNDRCIPPWQPEDLWVKVGNAFDYAQNDHPRHDPVVQSQAFTGLAGLVNERPRRTLRTLRDGRELRRVSWLLDKLLPSEGLGVLWGGPGSGKSMLAQALASAVATGDDVCGARARRVGGTLFLAAESLPVFETRLAHSGLPADVPFVWADDAQGMLLQPNGWQAATALIRAAVEQLREDYGTELRLIVVDTLSAIGALEEENDSGEMQRVANLWAQIGKQLGVLVLLVHHGNADGSRMRGSTALKGAADVVLHCKAGNGKLKEVFLEKSKASRDGYTVGHYTIESVNFTDPEGEPDSVGVLRWVEGGDVPQPKRPPGYDKVVEALRVAQTRASGELVSIPELLDDAAALLGKEPEEATKAVIQALDAAELFGQVARHGARYGLIRGA